MSDEVRWASGFAASGDIFTLVTAESELKAGDVIIIVNKNDSKALSTTQNDDNRAASAVTISGNDVKSADDTQEITLEGTSGAWYFNVGTGYLYAASSSANQLRTQTTKNNYSKAKITISSSSANIQFQGNNTRNILQYNPNTSNAKPLFACYKSASQKPISIYKKAASSKTPTTLTFTKPTINIEEGNETTFAGQPATLKTTGETVLNKTITYTTNNDAMFEAYEANVGPKALKASAYGTAIVTAKFNGDDTYEASTATYTVNYTEKPKIPTTLDFGFTTKTANINEPFTATATLKANDADLTGDITYKSSNSTCATVDEKTGVVTPLTVGQTIITAKYAGTKEYSNSDATYILNVIDPSDTRIIFDYNNEDYPAFENLAGSYKDNPETVDFVDIHGNKYAFTIKSGACKNISCQIGKGKTISSPIFNLANGYTVRVYYTTSANSKTLLLSVAEDKVYGVKYGKSWVATLSTTKDEAFSLTANSSNVCKVTKIEITPAVVLDENTTKEETSKFLEKNINKTIDIVTLTRTLVANKWNTFCVPFDTEIAGTALEGATVKTIGTIEGNVINLVDATKIEAGVPYLVMPTTGNIVNPTFKSVTITEISAKKAGNDEYKFVGTYSPKTISDQEFGTIWGVTDKGKLAKINAGTTMKGLRAYFVFPTNTAAAKLNFDGETTGINSIETEATVNGKVYNLNGQYVGNSLNGLKKGIYVVNGKKVIK